MFFDLPASARRTRGVDAATVVIAWRDAGLTSYPRDAPVQPWQGCGSLDFDSHVTISGVESSHCDAKAVSASAVASEEAFETVPRSVAEKLTVTCGASSEFTWNAHSVIECRSRTRSVSNPTFNRFHLLTPLREVLNGCAVLPRSSRSVRVHRREKGVALSLRSVMLCVMTETRPVRGL